MSTLVPGAAFVTGGGSGIGRAIASALAEAGAPVALVDVHPDAVRESAAQIRSNGGICLALAGDVSNADQVEEAMAECLRELGSIGTVVNAAGILDGYRPVDEIEPDVWRRVLEIHLTGTYLVCRSALPSLLAQGHGRIINISSVAGLVGAGGGAAYVTAKHGLMGLTRHMALSYADRGITVNAICPGPIATNLRANSMDILGPEAPEMMNAGVGANPDAWKAIIPIGRRGTVEEVAALAAFLASEAAAYITGQPFVIDGGWTAR